VIRSASICSRGMRMTDQQGDSSTIFLRSFKARVPEEFLLFSDAINRLAEGIWGGLPSPLPVARIKRAHKKESVGFANWRERAGQQLTESALTGAPTIYVFVSTQAASNKHGVAQASSLATEPVRIPVKVRSRLLLSHGSLPDRPIRPSIKTSDGDEKLFALLRSGVLVVRKTEFGDWYRSERARGRWPSQRSPSPKRRSVGRPSKQTDLRNAVLALAREGAWNGRDPITNLPRDPITNLHRHLVRSGRPDVPSCDTLARLVDQLHDETGELELWRFRRSRRRRT
jgi:hypothetical protein